MAGLYHFFLKISGSCLILDIFFSFDSSMSTSSHPKIEDEIGLDQQLQDHLDKQQKLEQQQVETAASDLQLLQLLADMNKMKRRCKHILDVTDRYCVLRPGKLGRFTTLSYF